MSYHSKFFPRFCLNKTYIDLLTFLMQSKVIMQKHHLIWVLSVYKSHLRGKVATFILRKIWYIIWVYDTVFNRLSAVSSLFCPEVLATLESSMIVLNISKRFLLNKCIYKLVYAQIRSDTGHMCLKFVQLVNVV